MEKLSKAVKKGIKEFLEMEGDLIYIRHEQAKLWYRLTRDDLLARKAFVECCKLTAQEQVFLTLLGSGAIVKEMAGNHSFSVGIAAYRHNLTKSQQRDMAEGGLHLAKSDGTMYHKDFKAIDATDIDLAFTTEGEPRTPAEMAEIVKKQEEERAANVVTVHHKCGGSGYHETTMKFKLNKETIRQALLQKPYMFTKEELQAIVDSMEG